MHVLKPILFAAAGALASTPAFAHHSPSAFDTRSEITVEGTLTKIDWANPHIYLTVETAGPDGQRMLQQIESVSIAAAQSSGLTRERLPLGSKVVVRGNPNRRGSGFTVLGIDVATSDGNTYPLGTSGRSSRPSVATVRATGLAGNWAPKLNPQLAPTVMSWPLTAKGRAALGSVMSGRTQLSVGCTALPVPMLTQLPQLRTLEVSDDRVVMKIDADGADATRIVRLNLAEHPANVVPSLFGHSIGQWDGLTLVIDTVAFTPHELGIGFGIPSSAGKHLVERLTLAADGLQLRYELTVEDPEFLAMPATYTALWDHRPDLALSGAPCDPDIARRYREE